MIEALDLELQHRSTWNHKEFIECKRDMVPEDKDQFRQS